MIGKTLSNRAASQMRGVGIEHDCGPLEPGRDLREQLKPLACQRGFQGGEAGDVPARLVEPGTMLLTTGSATFAKTIGIVRVSRWRATVTGAEFARMMSGCRLTNSCASARIRLLSSPPQRRS